MDIKVIFIYLVPISTILLGTFLSFRTDILKDSTREKGKLNRPYSFARTQLMWWTLIIIAVFSAYYGCTGDVLDLNSSCLVLLGISLGTTTSARIIDNTDMLNGAVRHQDINTSLGFLIDILSDENGISVHRFQALVFNLIFGGVFIQYYMVNGKIIDFDPQALTLMGISSAAYIGLKLNENTTPQGAVQSNNAIEEDDLQDIDESYYASLKQNDH